MSGQSEGHKADIEAAYAQADEQCLRPSEASCTCGSIKPYGTGPHICVGDEPEVFDD